MPGDGIVAGVYPGVRLWMNPVDWIEYLMLRDGAYEPLTLDFIQRNLRPGESAIVAGVNNGLHAIVAARAVGPTGRVLGCEPQPGALLKARRNMALNGMSEGPLRLVATALGSDRGVAPMAWAAPDNPGQASLLTPGPGFVAPLLTLAEIAAALAPGPLRLLLLDVQGYEMQVLDGLGTLRPEILIIEDDPAYSAEPAAARQALYVRLRGLGYSLRDMRGSPLEAPDAPLAERNLVGVLAGREVR
jgi:FkbM family methyltransferase